MMAVQICLNQTKESKYGDTGDLENDVVQFSESKDTYMQFKGICTYLVRLVTEYVTAEYLLSSVLTDLYLYLPWALRDIGGRSWGREGV